MAGRIPDTRPGCDHPDPSHRKNPHTRAIAQAQRSAPALPTSTSSSYVRHSVTGKD